METFFFIPVQKLAKVPHYLEDNLVDHIIIDLEESLRPSEFELYVEQLQNLENKDKIWVRPLLRVSFADSIQLEMVRGLIKLGFTKFIWPKLISGEELIAIEKEFEAFNIVSIPLIEHPRLLADMHLVLSKLKFDFVGIGNHDFFTITNERNTPDNLNFLRRSVSYAVKAWGIQLIDTACMELNNDEALLREIKDAIDIGYDAKFFIHPKQLDLFYSNKYFSDEEITWAKSIIDLVESQGGVSQFVPQRYNGKIVERPHVKWALKILKLSK
jgi:citrate lyase beta subunit